MKRNSKFYLILTFFQIIIGIAGVAFYFYVLLSGGATNKLLAVFIISVMLIVLGVGDLIRVKKLEKLVNEKLKELPETEEENVEE